MVLVGYNWHRSCCQGLSTNVVGDKGVMDVGLHEQTEMMSAAVAKLISAKGFPIRKHKLVQLRSGQIFRDYTPLTLTIMRLSRKLRSERIYSQFPVRNKFACEIPLYVSPTFAKSSLQRKPTL